MSDGKSGFGGSDLEGRFGETGGSGEGGGFREIEEEGGYATVGEAPGVRIDGRVTIEEGRRVFAPGDEVAGTVEWHLPGDAERVDLRLHWRTEGKGTQDVDVVAEESWENPGPRGEHPYRFRLPAGPYSFSGTLISLVWGLELVAEPTGRLDLLEITVSPTGAELRLGTVDGSDE